jgi:acyl carrier protein
MRDRQRAPETKGPEEVYLDWVNNYLTIAFMSSQYGVSEDHLRATIEEGRSIHESNVSKHNQMITPDHLQNVKNILAEELCFGTADITSDSNLRNDLGVDSLDDIDLITAFEEEYGIDIPDEDFETWITVQDIVDYLKRRTAPLNAWKPFFFESSQFFETISDMNGWENLRNAYPALSDEDFLNAKEATYGGNREPRERDEYPNYGFRSEHDGERLLKDFFSANNMEVEPRI